MSGRGTYQTQSSTGSSVIVMSRRVERRGEGGRGAGSAGFDLGEASMAKAGTFNGGEEVRLKCKTPDLGAVIARRLSR